MAGRVEVILRAASGGAARMMILKEATARATMERVASTVIK